MKLIPEAIFNRCKKLMSNYQEDDIYSNYIEGWAEIGSRNVERNPRTPSSVKSAKLTIHIIDQGGEEIDLTKMASNILMVNDFVRIIKRYGLVKITGDGGQIYIMAYSNEKYEKPLELKAEKLGEKVREQVALLNPRQLEYRQLEKEDEDLAKSIFEKSKSRSYWPVIGVATVYTKIQGNKIIVEYNDIDPGGSKDSRIKNILVKDKYKTQLGLTQDELEVITKAYETKISSVCYQLNQAIQNGEIKKTIQLNRITYEFIK